MTKNDIAYQFPMSREVGAILKKACYDCHSNQTVYPWYAHLQPLHWYLNDHIQSGKKELNFSEFASYSVRKQQNKLRAIASSIESGAMPLTSYQWLHSSAVLSESEKQLLLNWIENAQDRLMRPSAND